MGYRSIFISNPCRLSVKRDQLIVYTDTDHSIPIEDIRNVVVENMASSVSAYALSKLSENGVCVFFCDEKHMPSAIVQPFGLYVKKPTGFTDKSV